MKIGLIGSGNMARALARGWEMPVLCSDPVPERARALAEEVGGEALASNVEVAQGADVIVLCHKPAQLESVAEELGSSARAIVSILGGMPLARVRGAYPDRPVYRVIPSLPVEVRAGAVVMAAGGTDDPELDGRIAELFARLGALVTLEDHLLDTATALMSCAPAYLALVAEAQVDAGLRRGLPAAQGAELVIETMAGTAELLRRRGGDTIGLRREVSSPGGMTARGVDALERGGLRSAFSEALDAALQSPSR